MINSICKFNLFLGTFFNTSVFLDLDIFSHFGKYQQQTIAADEPGRMMVEVFLDRHRPCRSHNSLIAYDPDPDDDPDESLSSFFASFSQDLVLACVSSH